MKKLLRKNLGHKMDKLLGENEGDLALIKRVQHWRNLQVLDKKFDKKKQKVLWPLYDPERDSIHLD